MVSFDNSQWTRDYLNQIRIEKGLEPVTDQVMDLKEFKDYNMINSQQSFVILSI